MKAALAMALVLAGCASAPKPAQAARSMLSPNADLAPSMELPPPVTVPGLTRDCLGAEGAVRLHGGFATGATGVTLGVASLTTSGKLPESWTPAMLVIGVLSGTAAGVFSYFHGEYQGVVRQCVEDAHAQALEKLTASIQGAKP